MTSPRRTRLIEHFDAVRPRVLSLDVFDTLLARPFEHPTDLFAHVPRALREAAAVAAPDFLRLRVAAEASARRSHPSGEITVEEVCAELSRALGGAPCAETLLEAEIATERSYIALDRDVAALISHAHARGVPYVLVSDMYLRAEHIRSLLVAAAERSGLELPPPLDVFVSGERRSNKGGAMFDEVLAELGCAAAELLHVGDHEHSDVAAPRRRGIHAFHYVRETPYVSRVLEAERRYVSQGDGARYDAGLRTIRAKAHVSLLPADGALDHRAFGAFVLGPILTLFAEWVVEDCRRNAQDTVFCLMREGHLLAQLIDEAAREAAVPLNVKKLWVSRYAIRGASFESANERELRAYLAKRRAPSIGTVARDLGVDLALLTAATGVSGDAPLGPRELDAVVAAVTASPELRRQVLAAAAEKRARLLRYFDAMGVFASDRMTVVDVGWNGTIQALLADVIQAADAPRPRHVRGLYLATNPRLLELPVDRCSADSFLFHLGQPRETCDILRRTPEILEHACMPELGSLRGIDARGEPETFPQPIAARQLAEIAELQAGVRHFASLWLPGAAARRRGLTHDDWSVVLDRLRAILARSLQNPTLEEAQLFAGWRHDDNDGSLETEPLLGDDELRHRARFMTWDQLMRMSALECFWPQGLARLVGKGEEGSSRLFAAALRLPAVRGGARLLSRSVAALARVLGR